MPANELWNKRFFSAQDFGKGHVQPCMSKTPCDNVLVIDQLGEGEIWACAKCLAKHEFYVEYASGPGGRLRYGVCRLLEGDHVRSGGEPLITEFMEKP